MGAPLAYATLGSSRTPGRQWTVRLRRYDGDELVVTGNLGQLDAEHLAEQLNCFFQPPVPGRPGGCANCGAAIAQADDGRPRAYCSHRCRQQAYRRRRTVSSPGPA